MLQGVDRARGHAGSGPRSHTGRGGRIRDDHRGGFVLDQPCVVPWRQNLLTPSPQENDTSTVVAFTDVKIGFDEGDVLRGVSFEVMPRETLVLLGETGTGKTLTLKLAAGPLKPTQGKIEGLGQGGSSMGEMEMLANCRNLGVGVQEGALFD